METSRRLEILFVAERLLPAMGGGERYALELLGSLAQRHDVHALWFRDEKPTGTAVRELPPNVDGRAYPPRRHLRTVSSVLSERRYDVVVTQAKAAPAAVAAAEQAGVPSVMLLPSYVSLCPRAFIPSNHCRPELGCLACANGSLLGRRKQRVVAAKRARAEAAVTRATALIAPSETVADTYARWTGRRPEVAAPVVSAHPPIAGLARGHVAVISAEWTEVKGADLLAPIARGLADRRVVVSERRLPRPARRQLARLPHVRLAEYAPVAELLSGASVLLVPSQWQEPFGRIAFEALSAGVPVLASAIGGLTEFVPRHGLVRPHSEPEAWLRAIRSLDDVSRWEEARRRGLEAAERVLATRPVERIESFLLRAAS